MKTNQLIVGLALGLGLLMVFGFQNRGNEDGDGEIAIVEIYVSFEGNSRITYYYPDGSIEKETHLSAKGKGGKGKIDIDSNHSGRITALNKMAKLGYDFVSSAVFPSAMCQYIFQKR